LFLFLQYGAGGNTQKGTSLNTAKLDAETEELKHKTVDISVGKVPYCRPPDQVTFVANSHFSIWLSNNCFVATGNILFK
jgi:hypothetical protein